MRARLSRLSKPIKEAAATAQKTLDAAIIGRKEEAELKAAFAAYSAASERAESVEPVDRFGRAEINPAAAYRSVINFLAEVPTMDPDNLPVRLSNTRQAVQQLGGARANAILTVLDQWERATAEAAKVKSQERREAVRQRLVAAKKPADLESLIADLGVWSRDPLELRNVERASWIALASELSGLAATWSGAKPAGCLEQSGRDGSHSFAAELRQVRLWVDREALSRSLQLPELLAPPLSEKPLEAALETVCDQLAAKSEWQRLYQLLTMRGEAEAMGRLNRGAPAETLTALRAFLSGQNLELAGQWAEAVRSYKTVLQSPGPRAPVEAAAERVRAITREHPEAAATPPAPSPFPQ